MTLPSMIQDLMRLEAYAEKPARLELIQTHISFVILTDRYVYKIKKPVDFGFLDFTTLEKRHHFCEEEVRLNRRLSPNVYLGLVEIKERGSHCFYGGEGKTVDFAVKMLHLPEERMVANLLHAGKVDEALIGKIAKVLADFHFQAERSEEISLYGGLETITKNIEENFSQTEKYVGETLSTADFNQIRSYNRAFLDSHHSLFESRVREGRIRDCHGDLHLDHIYDIDDIDGKIQIVDCIEFNERFRYGDVASDIAFLAMDLDHYGKGELSDHLVRDYIRFSGDEEVAQLIDFYKCYRAYVRGKVDSFELDDPALEEGEKEKVRKIARSYFELALSYAGG